MPKRKLKQTAAAKKARAYYRKNREKILRKRRAAGKRKTGSGVYANWLRKQKQKKGSGLVDFFKGIQKNHEQNQWALNKERGLKRMQARTQRIMDQKRANQS